MLLVLGLYQAISAVPSLFVVSGPERLPAGRMRADAAAAGPLPVHDLPDVDITCCRIVPGDVAGTIAVEVADARRS